MAVARHVLSWCVLAQKDTVVCLLWTSSIHSSLLRKREYFSHSVKSWRIGTFMAFQSIGLTLPLSKGSAVTWELIKMHGPSFPWPTLFPHCAHISWSVLPLSTDPDFKHLQIFCFCCHFLVKNCNEKNLSHEEKWLPNRTSLQYHSSMTVILFPGRIKHRG